MRTTNHAGEYEISQLRNSRDIFCYASDVLESKTPHRNSNYFDIYAGAIPAQLGALNSVTWLDLSDNQLSGERGVEI